MSLGCPDTGAERHDANPWYLIRVIPAEESLTNNDDIRTGDAPAFLSRHDCLAETIFEILTKIRATRPRIHAITSPVAQVLTANGLLALGAIPSLTTNAEETETFITSANGLLLNLGMLDRERFDVIPIAAQTATAMRCPFVIDPVFADRSVRRRALARTLLASGPSIVKLNASEAEAFSRDIPETTTRLITGPVDLIRLGRKEARLANGHVLMERVTATGCLLGAILAASCAVENDPFPAAIAGVSILNIAAEIAAKEAAGPGSFAVRLIDALATLDYSDIQRRFKLEFLRDDAS
jgi:hydroxyethylthiazole kinase